jgi:hypothetical protein
MAVQEFGDGTRPHPIIRGFAAAVRAAAPAGRVDSKFV